MTSTMILYNAAFVHGYEHPALIGFENFMNSITDETDRIVSSVDDFDDGYRVNSFWVNRNRLVDVNAIVRLHEPFLTANGVPVTNDENDQIIYRGMKGTHYGVAVMIALVKWEWNVVFELPTPERIRVSVDYSYIQEIFINAYKKYMYHNQYIENHTNSYAFYEPIYKEMILEQRSKKSEITAARRQQLAPIRRKMTYLQKRTDMTAYHKSIIRAQLYNARREIIESFRPIFETLIVNYKTNKAEITKKYINIRAMIAYHTRQMKLYKKDVTTLCMFRSVANLNSMENR